MNRQVVWDAILRTAQFAKGARDVEDRFKRIEKQEKQTNASSVQGSNQATDANRKKSASMGDVFRRYQQLAASAKSYTQQALQEASATKTLEQRQQALASAQEKLADKTTVAERAARRAEAAQRAYASAVAAAQGVATRDQSDRIAAAQDRLTDSRDRHSRALKSMSAAAAQVESAEKALSSSGNGLGRVLGAVAGGFDRVGKSVPTAPLAHLLLTFPAIVTAGNALISMLSSLVGGLGAVAGAVGPAVGALAALPQALSIGAGVIGTFIAGLSGVGDALKAGNEAQAGAAKAATDTAEAHADAARQIVLAQRAVRDAHRGVADAARNGARAIAAAVDQETDAYRRVVEATAAVNDARQQAIYKLQDLKRAVEDEALSEERASLSVEQARERLQQVMLDPNASALEKKDAELAVKEAESRLEQTRDQADRTRKEYEKAAKQGVEKSDEVVAAKAAERDALKALADAHRGVADAEREAARSRQQAAETLADAQYNLKEAYEDAAKAGESAGAAQNKFAEAMDKLSPAGRAFVKVLMSLKDEWLKIRDAAQAGLLPGLGRALQILATQTDFVADAFFRFGQVIGQTAVGVAQAIVSLDWGPIVDSNVKIMETLGGALVNVVHVLHAIMTAAIPLTEWLADSVAGWTASWRAMTSGEAGQKRLTSFFERTRETLDVLGRIIRNVFVGLVNTFGQGRDAGMELLTTLEDVTAKWAEWTGTTEGKNRIKEYFDSTVEPMKAAGRLIRDITKAFITMGSNPAIAGWIEQMRTELGPALSRLSKSVGTDLVPNLIDLLVSVVDLFAILGPGAASVLQGFAKALTAIGQAIKWANENIPGFQSALKVVMTLLATATVLKFAGGLMKLFSGFGLLMKVLRPVLGLFKFLRVAMFAMLGPWGLVAAAVAALVIGAIILYKKWKPFRDLVNKIGTALKSGFLDVWEKLKPVLKEVGEKLLKKLVKSGRDLWDMIKKDLVPALKDLWESLKPGLKALGKVAKVVGGAFLLAWVKWAKFLFGTIWPVLIKFFGFLLGNGIQHIVDFVKGIIQAFSGLIEWWSGFIDIVTGIFTGDWGKVWEGAQKMLSGFVDIVVGLFKSLLSTPIRLIKKFATKVIDFFKWLFDVLVGHSIVPDLIKAIIDLFVKFPIKVLKAVGGFVRDLISKFKEMARSVGEVIKNFVSDKLGDLVDGFKAIPGKIKEFGKDFLSAGKHLMDKIFEGLKKVGDIGLDLGALMFNTIITPINKGLQLINDGIPDFIDLPGPINFNPPNNPIPLIPEIKRNRGGGVPGYGNTDTVPAMLTPGEFVLRKDAVKRIGLNRLHALNEGRLKFNRGGQVPNGNRNASLVRSDKDRKRKKREGFHGDASPAAPRQFLNRGGLVQHFHRGGQVAAGIARGAKGKIPLALEWLVGARRFDGTWDSALDAQLRRVTSPGQLSGPPAASTRMVDRLLKYVKSANVRRDVYTGHHKVKRGETVRDIVRQAYGDPSDRELRAFLIANGFTKKKVSEHTVTTHTPGTPGTAGSSGNIGRAATFARQQAGKPYIWGAVGPRGYDCSGFQSAITNVMLGRSNPYSRLFATGSMAGALPRLGFVRGNGGANDYTVGWYTGSPGHTSGRVGTLNAESTGDHVRVGSAARSPNSFPNVMHLRGRGSTGGTAGTPATTSSKVVKTTSTVVDKGALKTSPKPGTRLNLPGLVRYLGARTWGDVNKRFDLSAAEELQLLRTAMPGLKKTGVKGTALRESYGKRMAPIVSAIDYLADKVGVGSKSKVDGNSPNLRKAMVHVLDHLYERPHDDFAYRPWAPWTAAEAATINQEAANKKQAEFYAFLEKISGWGYTDLIDDLLAKGVDEGYNIARDASKNQTVASRLNDALKQSKLLSSEDQALLLKMVSAIQSSPFPIGLRDLARQLGVSDLTTVDLAERANKAGRLSTIPAAKMNKLWEDIRSYRGGTFYANTGGQVPGVGNTDSVPAMLTPGEFVLRKAAVKALGIDYLHMLNDPQHFARGGFVAEKAFSLAPPTAVKIPGTAVGRQIAASSAGERPTITYDIDIHNPVAETSSRSLTKALQRRGATKGTVSEDAA